MISPLPTVVLSAFVSTLLTCLIAASNAQAQNLLVNGDFESTVAPAYGDNIGLNLAPWIIGENFQPAAGQLREVSIAKVDGAGGQPFTPVTRPWLAPPTTQIPNLPVLDANNTTPGNTGNFAYFIAQNSEFNIGQRFVAPQSGCVSFRAKIAQELPALPVGIISTGSQKTLRFGKVSNTVVAEIAANTTPLHYSFQSPLVNYFHYGHEQPETSAIGYVSSDTGWNELQGYETVVAGETYFLGITMKQGQAIDDASVAYVDAQQCLGLAPLSPQDVTLSKTCAPLAGGAHNGDVGQLWNCSVSVTTPTAPFIGTLMVSDVVTPTSTTFSQIISAASTSGNFDCSNVNACSIDGSAFDSSGTEQIDYQLFVTSTAEASSYPLENCVSGSYQDDTGSVTPITGNCVPAQWIPRTEIVKTCDPLPAGATAPYALNCQLQVTANNLPTGSYVTVLDAFIAQPPAVATVTPSFMNVTSTENWSCVDVALNTPASTGVCELPALDMLTAGGTSTLNVSFQFDVDQAPTQVANCRWIDITQGSVIEAMGGQRSATRNPAAGGWPNMPDGCVYVDIPATPVTSKIDQVESSKTCEQPVQAVVNGVLGYTWDCQAKITVTPTPFAGTYTLLDDASNISIGTAQFLSVSESNCSPLGLDHISCTLDGATMSAPHFVDYQLFTPLTDQNEVIKWENCLDGHADTAAGTYPAVHMCTGRVIKPEITVVDPKDISLKKACGEPVDAKHDGEAGKIWSCEITVSATPAPFAGSFSFVEDASAVSGTSNANIIGYASTNSAWGCSGSFPQPQTQCSINGIAFSPTGVETIQFDLFASDQGNAVKWQNCVNGSYTSGKGDKRDVKGNCVDTGWDTPKGPPVIALKKGCRAMGVQNGNAYYLCSIYVSPPSSGALTGPLTLDELFTTTSGAPASQYIQALLGTPAAPNGWVCQQPAFANGASCTISAADFNGNTGHRIDAQIAIPTAVLEKEGFKNCAQVRIGDQVVGASDCIDITTETETTFDVEKTCEANGERTTLGPNGWYQAYQCTLTVTTNGVPFTGPLWLLEDLHFGSYPGQAYISSLTSADPWDCASPPYAAPGQGTSPYCGIQGTQFPASGSSTLIVDMMMNGAMDQFGAENCASISVGEPTASGLPAPIASDCFEIAPTPNPKEPSIDLVKTCSPAQQSVPGQWTVACVLTITGQNLPAGQQVRVTDELMSSSTQTAVYGQVMGPTNACGGGQMNGGTSSACDISTDDINAAPGGVLSIPFAGTYQGPAGRPINGAQAQNCAYVDVTTLGLHGPTGGNGKSCVPVTFPVTSVGGTGPVIGGIDTPLTPTIGTGVANPGPIIGTPVTPTRPIDDIYTQIDPSITVDTTIPPGCGFDTLFLIDRSGSMNLHNRLPLTKQAVIAALRIFEGGGSKSGAMIFNQSANIIGGPSVVLPSPALESAIVAINAAGNEDWQVGMTATNTAVSGLTDKPLVLFIADGVPGKPFNGNAAQNINAAAPALNALRNQGSRVVGIALGYTSVANAFSTLLGPNLVTAGGNVAIDPLTTDVIHIPESAQIIPAFEAIARAYCPDRKGMTQPQKDALMAAMQAVPKTADVYMGDDEDLEQDAVVQPPILPIQSPALTIVKEQTGACEANRASQTYDCGFRLSVTNTGTGPYVGPLVMTDTAGNPGIKSATAISGNGWSCGAVVRDTMSCTNAAVNLAPGASSYVDLRMKVKGLRNGGTFQNCASTGVTQDRRQRVALIQKVMNDRGLNAGPVDGDPGRKTYAALAKLRGALGLPINREFDDALFTALGLPLQNAAEISCVTADLAPMPAPPLQCNAKTTVASGEGCACRYDNMERRTATACQCRRGFALVAGKGCQKVVTPKPQTGPKPAPICDLRSTYLRGDSCACIDGRNARNISKTQCGCKNGLPMVNGQCIPIKVRPKPQTEGPATPGKCRIKINGICIN